MEQLEKLVDKTSENAQDNRTLSPQQMAFSHFYKETLPDYLVDLSAGLIFYNPLMAGIIEPFIGQMEWDEVGWSRLYSSAMQCITMRPTGWLRNVSANRFGLTEENPWYQKCLSDITAIWTFQLPAYGAALVLSGASLDEGITALTAGLAITGATNNGTKLGFGKWMDFWRGLWGKKKAIK